ncbi:MAG: hypothetical protein ABSB67_23545 [Bryobacteraceae bacterium]
MPNLPLIWSVDNPVGKTCRNEHIDVMLVQYFLRRIVQSGGYPAMYRPSETWEIDGCYRDSLGRGIQLFQAFMYKMQGDMHKDLERLPQLVNGRVDPVRPGDAGGFQSMRNSTMLYLNRSMRLLHREEMDGMLTTNRVNPTLNRGLMDAWRAHLKRQTAGLRAR